MKTIDLMTLSLRRLVRHRPSDRRPTLARFRTSGLAHLFGMCGFAAFAALSLFPPTTAWGCACSEVVIGQGTVSSHVSVDDSSAELALIQSDIELPGVIPVELVRLYKSGNGQLGPFGYGWTFRGSAYLETTTGDIEINIEGGVQKFPQADNYYNKKKTMRVIFSGPDEITLESRRGEKWVFSVPDKTLSEYIDPDGNVLTYAWKSESVQFWDQAYTIYCPTSITYPDGRALTFSYSTDAGQEHLCTEATSPSGFTVGYSYQDSLLTGISKSNGQILSYSYHTQTHPDHPEWVMGWMESITYANGATVSIENNGNYGSRGDLRITRLEGPEGFDHQFAFTELKDEQGEVIGTELDKTDSRGNITTYEYAQDSKLFTVTDAYLEDRWVLKNDEYLPATIQNRRGYQTTLSYDTNASDPFATRNTLSVTNPLNQSWSFQYDSRYRVTEITNPLNQTTTLTRDSAGNILTLANALGQTVETNTWTSGTLKGQLATTTDGAGNLTSFTYNSLGFLTKITDPANEEWSFAYADDGSGNLTATINPLGKTWARTVNGFYKTASLTDPLGNTTAFDYDDMANLTKVTDAEGNTSEFTWDKLQRMTSIKDALSHVTTFTYDPESNLTTLTDPRNHQYSYTYDKLNRTETFVFPDASQESYLYDANGNLTGKTNRAGNQFTFTYDAADRLTAQTRDGSIAYAYGYDDANRRTSTTRTLGGAIQSQIGWTYNAAGQTTAVAADGYTTGYQYDSAQRLDRINYPSGVAAEYDYTARSRIAAIKDELGGSIAAQTFDEAGRLTKRTLANGLETVYTYDDANRVTSIMLRETATPSNVIQSFQYGYDKVGNRLWIQYADGTGDVYDYDATYQLTGVKYGVTNPQAGYAAAANPDRTVVYQYDSVGNRTQVADDANLTTYTANNLNQYTQVGTESLSYNGNGALSAYDGWTYLYDQAGNLIQASRSGTAVTYTYDAIGRRLTRTENGETTRYVYSGWQVIEERDGTGTLQAAYTWANGIDHPVRMVKDGNTYYYQQDALGNVTALTDSSGNLVERYEYDAFGAPTIYDSEGEELEAPLQPYLFTAREYDATTGLYDYRTRSYSPELGRFLQPDTIDFAGGDVNLYRYVGNGPQTWRDPLGTFSRDFVVNAWTAAGTGIGAVAGFALGGGGGFLAGGGVASPVTTPAGAIAGAAALGVAGGVAGNAVGNAVANMIYGSGAGSQTPRDNKKQNKQFSDACKEIEKKIGRKLSKEDKRKLHDEISGQGYGYHDIVDEGVAMFGTP